MEGLLQPTHLFFLLLFVMFIFPALTVVIVFVLLKRGKPPGPGKSSEKDNGDLMDAERGGVGGSTDKKQSAAPTPKESNEWKGCYNQFICFSFC
jgi:hypothetical protein